MADNAIMSCRLRARRACVRLCASAALIALAACSGGQAARQLAQERTTASPPAPALIPLPASIQLAAGEYIVRDGATIRADDPHARAIAAWFGELVQRTRGLRLPQAADADAQAAIVFALDANLAYTGARADEAYAIAVSAKGIVLRAATAHGLFNGATTLWQLLTPPGAATGAPTRLPLLHIADHPRFAWRGLMLDSARHLQSPEYIKQFIDAMALHKYNVLHWHLTDDQGWRVEIKKYPNLTTIGAWRRPAGRAGTAANGKAARYGGYYTQEQIRDIVAYARARYVTIVPEIEMPGHAQAAIAAYPEFGVAARNPGVSHDWGVHTYLYNVEDSTFIFLQEVLTEIMALFPSPYIHIGGDEAAKDQWQTSARVQARMRGLGIENEAALQAWFITRIEAFLNARGRKLVGWDEILEGGLPPQATVMSWRGSKGAIDAARQGHDVVLSPDPDLYFNNLPSDLPDEPAGRAHVVSLHDVYAFEPVPKELDADAARHVLGAQANLWSEYLPTDASVSYAAYPRAAALAEVLWSPSATRDWHGFLERLVAQHERYRMLGIGYAQSAFAVRIDPESNALADSVTIHLSNQTGFGEIRYTLDGSAPTPASPQYTAPLALPAKGAIRAAAFAHASALARASERALDPVAIRRRRGAELAPCRPDAGVHLRLPDDRPADAHRAAYAVEILDPCWRWPGTDLDGVTRIEVGVARLPYNFQLWKDIKSVVTHKPSKYPGGELQIRADRCDGELLAAIPLAAPPNEAAAATSLSAPLHAQGNRDLCLRFATSGHDPLWVIDHVQLVKP